MKRNFCNILLLLVVLIGSFITGCQSPSTPSPTPQPVQPVEREYQEGIIKKVANLREGPSTDTKIIRKASAGTKVKILETQDNWYKILCSDGVEAFVFAELLKVVQSPSPESPVVLNPVTVPQKRYEGGKIFITLKDANMRSGPGTQYEPPFASIKAGVEFAAVGDTNNWIYGTAQGKTGWIHSKLLQDKASRDSGTVSGNNGIQESPIFSEPTSPRGSGIVQPVAGSIPPASGNEQPVPTGKTVSSGRAKVSSSTPVSVRMQASAFGKVIGEVAPGQEVQIIDCQGSWCEIKISNGTGYVKSVNLVQGGN